ncbi:msr2684 [Mesorhizobium japonicum MAFF 303099]|uniref:Msr2684 protein n=1 Tax=Mesorhizobium japonicum (strain LMG 29417 / CECT 9101 / MAFF 303099) TaxID=266835 RepID=Q98HW4_RHILO|nr:msr2684 [Mesorhizobium japonicum MAFF 303099]
MLKGYFSAISEGKDTTVIYVWDVYDPSGNRLHRINGQMKAPSVNSAAGAGADSWKGVSPATMQAIADQTIDQFAAFLGGKAG